MEQTETRGAVVDSVELGSLAEDAGLRPGDVIAAINGQAFNDLIEYRFLTAEEVVLLDVLRAGEALRLRVEKDVDDGLGIVFTDAVFDGIRKCRNSCVFCFIHQMPQGMRESLYVEDDDFRLSVTHGNYVTLTNMAEEDLQRILKLHLSPIYISVHATDPAVRIRMLRNKRAGRLMPLMQRLADAGMEMHCQIVLCPGYNDGEVLDRTLQDLAGFSPDVLSVAVVPLGLTRFREKLTPMQPVDEELARRTVAQIEGWRERFLQSLGTRFVFAADELYLKAGVPVPSREEYEEFPQIEDGIGLSRLFLDELDALRRKRPRRSAAPERILLVTGILAAPMVESLAAELRRLTGHVVEALPVTNHFFGESITVAGLLTGRDIAAAVRAAGPANRVYVPAVVLKGDRFLDDLTLDGMSEALGTPVLPVEPSPAALAKELMAGTRPAARGRCPESRGQGLYVSDRSVAGAYPAP